MGCCAWPVRPPHRPRRTCDPWRHAADSSLVRRHPRCRACDAAGTWRGPDSPARPPRVRWRPGPSDHRQPERGLFQPSPSDRQREPHFVLVVSLLGREKVIQRGAGLVHLPVDERAAHAVPGGQDTDGFSARQSPNGHHLAFVGRLFCGGGANGLIHGDAGLKIGRHYPTACFSPLMCNAALNLVENSEATTCVTQGELRGGPLYDYQNP